MVAALFGKWRSYCSFARMGQARAEHYTRWAKPFHNDVGQAVGVTAGNIYHLWHGAPEARQSTQRHRITEDFDFDPSSDLIWTPVGVGDGILTSQIYIERWRNTSENAMKMQFLRLTLQSKTLLGQKHDCFGSDRRKDVPGAYVDFKHWTKQRFFDPSGNRPTCLARRSAQPVPGLQFRLTRQSSRSRIDRHAA